MLKPLLLLIVLIFLNAIFASAEIAVLSTNEAKLNKLAENGNARAKKLVKLTSQPSRFLATIQVAITLAGLLQSAFAAENFAEPLVALLISAGVTISESFLKTMAIVVITLVLSYFTLVFGELVPKRLAMKKSEKMALGMSHMLYGVSKIFAPLVWLLTVSTNGILRILGMNPDDEDDQVTEEEIKLLIMEGNEQGNIRKEEKEIIQNVFEFDDISADELCTHRRDVIILNIEDSDEEWAKIIHENRHTFYPVCGESADEMIAVLDTRDYFRLENKSRQNLMSYATEKPFFVPNTIRANALFEEMKSHHTYFAVVIDEYGGMSGIITLHDIIESLVGKLNDECNIESEPDIVMTGESLWQIQGTALMRDVSAELNLELPTENCDTFSGYICSIIGRIPRDGEKFECETDDLAIEVHEVHNHMVRLASVHVKSQNQE